MTLFDPEATEVVLRRQAEHDGGDVGWGPPPRGALRAKLVVAYDGRKFKGFAFQPGQRTVAGVLSDAIAKVARHQVKLGCAGRTDAGVHARGQVVHVDLAPEVDLGSLVRSVNAICGGEVVVLSAQRAPHEFDARHCATGRRYRYLVLESAVPDPLLSAYAWQVPGPLELRAMAQAADAIVGEHDFRAFCRRPPGTSPEDPIFRRVNATRWSEVPCEAGDLPAGARLLRFDIEANAFCHQMVRSVVSMLVEVGKGRQRAGDVYWLLRCGDRSQAPAPAPAHGLCLVSVQYPPWPSHQPDSP